MQTRRNYGGIDLFRLAAAFLVVAIHTSPLMSFSEEADFFLTRVLARLAVPFFFLVTGHFVLGGYFTGQAALAASQNDRSGFPAVFRYLRKILLLYGFVIVLYLPIGIYAGHYQKLTFPALLRMLFFDGTFYHLWYFPALLTGILLVCLLGRFFSLRICTAVSAVLYLLGLLGDSYWGLIADIPGISTVYEWGFGISSYTRNGIFLAPLFLLTGVHFHRLCSSSAAFPERSRIRRRQGSPSIAGNGACPAAAAGFLITLLLMTGEGFLLRHLEWQRHDSMYLLLPVCVYFLYRLLLLGNITEKRQLRTVSTGIYVLHPAVIVALRGAARAVHLEKLLVENSLVHYLAVCLLSCILSWGAAYVPGAVTAFMKKRPGKDAFYRKDRTWISLNRKDRAWISLDRNALAHNVAVLRSLLPQDCALMPAIKANAYGHGAVLVGRELNRLGIKSFCVASVSEGIELRRGGIRGEILILGYTHPKQFPLLRQYDLTQTVVDYEYALEMDRCGIPLKGHIAIDTGMHRLGERCDHMEHFMELLSLRNLTITGAMTHLCAVDSDRPEDREFTRRQADAFYRIIAAWKDRGFVCPKVHLQSSYGVLNYPELAGDYARVGIALYGVHSASEDYDGSAADLRPVLSLMARIAVVKELLPGEAAGYGLTFVADHPMRIATLSIGYGDGLPRALSGGVGSVLIHGQRASVIGRICMDQTIVDVTDIPEAHAGDTAVLIGRSGEEVITACDLAAQCGTITNEILSRLGARPERIIE